MSYRIERGEPLTDAVRRIATEQIDKARDELADPELDAHVVVHQVRKRCKKLRGLVRLVRPAFDDYADENRRFRDAARRLSDLRDATSLVECFDRLAERHAGADAPQPWTLVRERLLERRGELAIAQELPARLERFADELEDARRRVAGWEFGRDDWKPALKGARKTYKRARNAMAGARDETAAANLHEWRKRVKYHRYHTRLLRELRPEAQKARRDELDELGDLLGDEHDLAVFRDVLRDETGRFGTPDELGDLLDAVEAERARLQAAAFPAGRRLFALKPKRVLKLWKECVRALREEEADGRRCFFTPSAGRAAPAAAAANGPAG